MGCYFLLQGIFPTQESNPSLFHCKRILYHLSHQGSPRILEWVAYPLSTRSSWPRNQTGVFCIAGRFKPCEAAQEGRHWPLGNQPRGEQENLDILAERAQFLSFTELGKRRDRCGKHDVGWRVGVNCHARLWNLNTWRKRLRERKRKLSCREAISMNDKGRVATLVPNIFLETNIIHSKPNCTLLHVQEFSQICIILQ